MKITSPFFDTVLVQADNVRLTRLNEYLSVLQGIVHNTAYTSPESSLALANNTHILDMVLELNDKVVTADLKYHILIGIGGSNLGTKAIYDAMFGYFDPVLPSRIPRMLFADTTDPKYISALHDFVEQRSVTPEQLLFTVITKSGTTTETVANLEMIVGQFPRIQDRLVLISSADSKLTKHALNNNIHTLTMPPIVGGRYSVLSAVGLFPLVTMGIDVEMLQKGAWNITEECLNTDLSQNPAALSALMLYHYVHNGHNIHDTFLFHPELESLGRWYRQLMGESIGKSIDVDGKQINAGMTPTVSVGSTDLHSVGQLYLGGPNDKVTTFVSTDHDISDISVPEELVVPGLVDDIEGKSASTIMHAIYQGVQKTYDKHNLPYIDVKLETISEYELGAFMQFKMIEMMLLAKLLNVNAFDQPNVESYKEETRKILKEL